MRHAHVFMPRATLDTTGLIIEKGRYAGERFTRLPVSYLKWMVGVGHQQAAIAKAELDRRGTTLTYQLDITGHAIDRASTVALDLWQKTRKKDEGLHAWLHRLAHEALGRGDGDDDGGYAHMGLRFVIERDMEWPVLKTVIRKKGGKR